MKKARRDRVSKWIFHCLIVLGIVSSAPSLAQSTSAGDEARLTDENATDLIALVSVKPLEISGQLKPSAFRLNIDGELVPSDLEEPRDFLQFWSCYLLDYSSEERAYNRFTDWVYQAFEFDPNEDIDVTGSYAELGVNNLEEVGTGLTRDLLTEYGLTTPLEDSCEGEEKFTSAPPWLPDVMIVPRFVYFALLQVEGFGGSTGQYQALAEFVLPDLRERSAAIAAEDEAIAARSQERTERYQQLAQAGDAEFVGSLFVGINSRDADWAADDPYNQGQGFYRQRICSLAYQQGQSRATLGYRSLNNDILTQPLKEHFSLYDKPLRLDGEDGSLSFNRRFESLDAAYAFFSAFADASDRAIGDAECHIFVDYPENLIKLQSALSDLGLTTVFGRLVEGLKMEARFATQSGFESLQELRFVDQIEYELTWGQLSTLREEDVNYGAAFTELVQEIRASGYASEQLDMDQIVAYLADRKAGQEAGISAAQQRDKRVEAAQRAQAERREAEAAAAAEFAKTHPYIATLSCEFQGRHTNIAACFLGDEYGVDTTLEVTKNGSNQLYQAYELNRAGREFSQGLVIDLPRSFEITAQNTSENLTLKLTIVERVGGKQVFQDSAGMFGVVRVGN